jgi:3',5'-cyclic AMP phosphodiesterase CpdA
MRPYQNTADALATAQALGPWDAAIITGDCACIDGQVGDYVALATLLAPIRQLDCPIHLLLGNHDHRERFWAALAEDRSAPPRFYAAAVQTPLVNWFFLDSLRETNEIRGALGAMQIRWLLRRLEPSQKPAIVALHHNLDSKPSSIGLLDTERLLSALERRPRVKAVIFGHTHDWQVDQWAGIHLINLPPTAYVFEPSRPRGFLDARIYADHLRVTLHTLPKAHPQHGETLHLRWRQ